MGIMMVTSLNSYVKNMEMAVRWKERQEEKDYAPGSTGEGEDSASKAFQKKADEIRYPQYDRSSQMEADIELKLTAGKKLSGEEMLYLKNHDRAMYQKAKIINRERDAYEKALASCKTKDEVEQLKADYAAAAVRRLNAVRNDTGLSAEKKKELYKMEHYKAAALDDAMHEFMESSDYEQLPEGVKKPEGQEKQEKQEKGNSFDLAFDMESVSLQEIRREKLAAGDMIETAAKAAEYKVPAEEAEDKKEEIPEESTDDACEEGTIKRAILDEEARWAREKEEQDPDLDSQEGNQAQEETPEGARIRQARSAYLAGQAFMIQGEASGIDLLR